MRFMSYAAAASLAAVFTIGTAQAADISGAGATFPYPIYAK
jgi:phosphate transport system substrate-binding protein